MTGTLHAVPDSLDGLLPHVGRSRLITRVVAVDADSIVCEGSPLDVADHPLRVEGRIESSVLVEYAAQAMAIHGRLCSRGAGPAGIGYLIAVHDLRFGLPHVNDLAGALRVEARAVIALGSRISYDFVAMSGDGRELARGRASVALQPAGSPAERAR